MDNADLQNHVKELLGQTDSRQEDITTLPATDAAVPSFDETTDRLARHPYIRFGAVAVIAMALIGVGTQLLPSQNPAADVPGLEQQKAAEIRKTMTAPVTALRRLLVDEMAQAPPPASTAVVEQDDVAARASSATTTPPPTPAAAQAPAVTGLVARPTTPPPAPPVAVSQRQARPAVAIPAGLPPVIASPQLTPVPTTTSPVALEAYGNGTSEALPAGMSTPAPRVPVNLDAALSAAPESKTEPKAKLATITLAPLQGEQDAVPVRLQTVTPYVPELSIGRRVTVYTEAAILDPQGRSVLPAGTQFTGNLTMAGDERVLLELDQVVIDGQALPLPSARFHVWGRDRNLLRAKARHATAGGSVGGDIARLLLQAGSGYTRELLQPETQTFSSGPGGTVFSQSNRQDPLAGATQGLLDGSLDLFEERLAQRLERDDSPLEIFEVRSGQKGVLVWEGSISLQIPVAAAPPASEAPASLSSRPETAPNEAAETTRAAVVPPLLPPGPSTDLANLPPELAPQRLAADQTAPAPEVTIPEVTVPELMAPGFTSASAFEAVSASGTGPTRTVPGSISIPVAATATTVETGRPDLPVTDTAAPIVKEFTAPMVPLPSPSQRTTNQHQVLKLRHGTALNISLLGTDQYLVKAWVNQAEHLRLDFDQPLCDPAQTACVSARAQVVHVLHVPAKTASADIPLMLTLMTVAADGQRHLYTFELQPSTELPTGQVTYHLP